MGPDNWGHEKVVRRKTETEFPNYEQMTKAWLHFWSKNKLAVDENGRKYRTNVPREMPVVRDFDIKNRGFGDGNNQ